MKTSPLASPAPQSSSTSDDAKYWIDGQLVNRSAAALPLSDLGFTRGYAAFDALRTYQGVPFLLEQHLQRLEKTCALMFLRLPLARAALTAVISETLAANSYPESLVRIMVTGGDAAGFIPEDRERVLVLVDPLRTYPARQYEQGVGLATATLDRTLPVAKSTSYLAGVWETIQARRKGLDEVVFCDARGGILEGTTFSVVAARGRELVSPESGILPGITVEHVFQIAVKEGFTLKRQPLTREVWESADELFITSSTRELIPVNRIDDTWLGKTKPPGITRRLHELYRQSAHAICKAARVEAA